MRHLVGISLRLVAQHRSLLVPHRHNQFASNRIPRLDSRTPSRPCISLGREIIVGGNCRRPRSNNGLGKTRNTRTLANTKGTALLASKNKPYIRKEQNLWNRKPLIGAREE